MKEGEDNDILTKQVEKLDKIHQLLFQHITEIVNQTKWLLKGDKEAIRNDGAYDGYFDEYVKELDKMDEYEDVSIDYEEFTQLIKESYILIKLRFSK